MQAVAMVLPLEVIALDGKTVRGSADRANGKGVIHLVSAWASANRLVLGQVKVDAKSNEITAISELLRALALHGCQKDIARQILDQGGDYVLALKNNQPKVLEEVQMSFTQARERVFLDLIEEHARAVTKGRGRLEVRRQRSSPTRTSWTGCTTSTPGPAWPRSAW